MVKRNGRLLLPLLAGALMLGACESSSGLSDGARLTIKLTDAPAALEEAWVKIDSIYLIQSATGEGDAAKVKLTPRGTDWINLLTLSGGRVADLVTETVQPGTYHQLRVVVCNMYIKTKSGEIIATPGAQLPQGVTPTAGTELKLTSQCRSGFKVNLPSGGVTVDEGNNAIVIDFDAGQSFIHQAGRSGKWIVRPVLHAVKQENGGEIRGTAALQGVTLPVSCGGESLNQNGLLARFVPTATAGTTVRTGTTSGQGEFRINHVAPGTYTLGAAKVGFANGDSLTFAATPTPASVTVEAGKTANASYSVTGATCQPKS